MGSSSFIALSFCLFILFMGFSRQEYWSGLSFPSPVDHILSDLSTMTRPSWVAPGAWLSFIEWDKAVVRVIRLASCLWLWFQSVCLWCPLTTPTILLGFLLPWVYREGDDWGRDGWMASRTRWTWVWVNSGRWWWTGRPDVLQFMGSQRVGHDWVTELNLSERWTPQVSILLDYSGEITPERMKRRSQSKHNTQLWMWLVMEVNSDNVNSNIS